MMTQFSNNLKAKRLEFGWTQEKAASEITIAWQKDNIKNGIFTKEIVTEKRYQQWERKVWPKGKMLLIISQVFGIDDLILFMEKPVK